MAIIVDDYDALFADLVEMDRNIKRFEKRLHWLLKISDECITSINLELDNN